MLSDEAFKVFLQRYTLPVGADNPMVAGALRERAGRSKFNAFITQFHYHFCCVILPKYQDWQKYYSLLITIFCLVLINTEEPLCRSPSEISRDCEPRQQIGSKHTLNSPPASPDSALKNLLRSEERAKNARGEVDDLALGMFLKDLHHLPNERMSEEVRERRRRFHKRFNPREKDKPKNRKRMEKLGKGEAPWWMKN